MPIQGFIDDSGGGKGIRRVFVLAGFLQEAQWWAKFSDEWNRWRNVQPRLPYLKMDELKRLCAGWSADDITKKLAGFVGIIKMGELPKVMHVYLDLDKFEVWKHGLIRSLQNTFFLPSLAALAAVAEEQANDSPQEQCEVIFDNQDMFAPILQHLYPEIRAHLCEQNPQRATLPKQPRFEDDKDYPPLQAADMLAWIVRHRESGERHSYEWIEKKLDTLPRCRLSGEIQELASMTKEERASRLLSDEKFAAIERKLTLTKIGRRLIKQMKESREKD